MLEKTLIVRTFDSLMRKMLLYSYSQHKREYTHKQERPDTEHTYHIYLVGEMFIPHDSSLSSQTSEIFHSHAPLPPMHVPSPNAYLK